jgi:hypothetical protein
MPRAHGALVVIAAALCLCAQGCGSRAGAPQFAQAMSEPARPSATASALSAATPPAPYEPPYPAHERGAKAFEPSVSLSGGRRFESREVGQKPARKDLKVVADYPVLLGDDRPAAREFNRRARALVMGEVTSYLQDEPDPEKEKSPHWKDVEESHRVSHEIIFASDEVVSVLFYVTGYSWGAAHGYHYPLTLNFDLKAGRELELTQLFKPRSGYLRIIARLCAEDLNRQFEHQFGQKHHFGEGSTWAEGLKPKRDNYKSWVITRDGPVFIFEEYQVVAYADGEPKVLIPFDSLKEIINPRGALAGLHARE